MSQTKWQRPKYRFRLPEPVVARIRHRLLSETHVVVGDHEPERRAHRPLGRVSIEECLAHDERQLSGGV